VNFFGHALVASRQGSDPRWVLGAMMPDFASMCRARLEGSDDPVVSAGIAFHHRTDDAFHGAPTFLALYTEGIDALERRGVARGAARAVAHVGTELLLDGLLLDDAPAQAAYLDAVALPAAASPGLRFRGDGGARFAKLYDRLRDHGLPEDYRSPERVAHQLERILAPRPRLALAAEDIPRIVPWLRETRGRLREGVEGLLEEVGRALGPAPPDAAADPFASTRATVDTVRHERGIIPGRST
jgi:hypothetical protein